MMFDMYCIEKILNGEKTVTRRFPRRDGKRPAIPGSIHKLKADRTPTTFGEILITDLDFQTIGDIDDEEAKKEGFKSRGYYLAYLMDIYDIDILSDYDFIWRIEFELING